MSRSRVTSRTTTMTVWALGPVLAVSLAACGGSSSTGSATPAGATPDANATGAPGGRGFGGADFTKIQACLKAAGVTLPTGTRGPRPSGSFTPNGTPPSGAVRPSGVRPSGGFGGGRGGFGGGMFNTPAVKAALAACGITVPTGGGGGGAPGPTATS
jgi:hypothetical protein